MKHISKMQCISSKAKTLKSELERPGSLMACLNALRLRRNNEHFNRLKEDFIDSAKAFDVSNSSSFRSLFQ